MSANVRHTTPSLAIHWTQPAFLLPLFALPSLLGVSNSLAAVIGLAIALSVAVLVTLILIVLLRPWIASTVATATWVCVGGTVLASIELVMHAYFFALYRAQGLFLPLGVTACLVLARPEMQAAYANLAQALRIGSKMSGGLTLAAFVVGAARELVGRGSLMHDADALLGAWAAPLETLVFRADMGFLLALLAPGAFIGLGFGVALYNWLWLQIDSIRKNK